MKPPKRMRSVPRKAAIREPDSVTVGAYSGRLKKKGADSRPTGHRTCPAPKGTHDHLSGREGNLPKPKPTGVSKAQGNSLLDNVSLLVSDRRSLRQRYPLTYKSWDNMKTRCRNSEYEVHPSWLGVDGFAAFFKDMGERPNAAFTLDRMDSNLKEYGPGLCRWASKKTQTQNRRNTIHLTDASGVCRPLGEWAALKGVSADTMLKRKGRGWSDREVIHGPESPASPQESTTATGRWPPVGERAVGCWKKMYANRVWRGESRLDFVHRTATETMAWLWGTDGREGELQYLSNLVPPDEEFQDPSPEARAAADNLGKLTRLHHLMTVARDWALAGLRERNRKQAEAERARDHARATAGVVQAENDPHRRRDDEDDEDDG